MSKGRRRDRNNDDLIEAAQGQRSNILGLYKLFEDKRPVMVFDLQGGKIYAYPYEEFRDELNQRSRGILESQYERAIVEDKIVVFVRDDETRRFVSISFDNE